MTDTVDLTHAVDGGHKYVRWLHEEGREPVMVVLVPALEPDELLSDLVARLFDDGQDELYYGETATIAAELGDDSGMCLGIVDEGPDSMQRTCNWKAGHAGEHAR